MKALMNALQVIQQKDDTTPLDKAILFYASELPPSRQKKAVEAAEELDDLVDTIGNLREALEKSDTELAALRKELEEAKAEIERLKREHNPALRATSTASYTVTEHDLDKWNE